MLLTAADARRYANETSLLPDGGGHLEIIEKNLTKAKEDLDFIFQLLKMNESRSQEEYLKINRTYFKIFCRHYDSFLYLFSCKQVSSATVLLRTMLELYVKAYYLEFVAKQNGDSCIGYINEEKKYPSFFQMSKSLEEVTKDEDFVFKGAFMQFAKSQLATYEKLSFFTHGTGVLFRSFYENDDATFTTEQTSDLLETGKGMFEVFSMLFFHVQDKQEALKILVKRFK